MNLFCYVSGVVRALFFAAV